MGKGRHETKKHCVLCGVGISARTRGKGVQATVRVGKKFVVVKVYFCQNCWCKIVGETNRQHAVMLYSFFFLLTRVNCLTYVHCADGCTGRW